MKLTQEYLFEETKQEQLFDEKNEALQLVASRKAWASRYHIILLKEKKTGTGLVIALENENKSESSFILKLFYSYTLTQPQMKLYSNRATDEAAH